MFIKYAAAWICFPGGFGTLDEFFESMTLLQTGKVERIPVVLVGRGFWHPLIEWMREQQLERGAYIASEDLEMLFLTDDVEAAAECVANAYARRARHLDAPRFADPAYDLTVEGTTFGRAPRSPANG